MEWTRVAYRALRIDTGLGMGSVTSGMAILKGPGVLFSKASAAPFFSRSVRGS
jgi:hypothetical protein